MTEFEMAYLGNLHAATLDGILMNFFTILSAYLVAGFVNPVVFMLDLARERDGMVELKYKAPFKSTEHADDPEIIKLRAAGEPMDFGHTLEDQIGGQTDAGFEITGMFEDGWGAERSPLFALMNCYIATRARKP